MKLPLKLDKATIQGYLLQHGEKVAIGVVVFVVLSVFGATWWGVKRYPHAPSDLMKRITNLQQQVRQSTPDDSPPVPDYLTMARQGRVSIAEEPYTYSVVFDPPTIDQRPVRDQPNLYAVQQLRGAADMGSFAVVPTAEPATPPPVKASPTRTPRPRKPRGGRESRDKDAMEEPPEREKLTKDGMEGPGAEAARTAVSGWRWVVLTGLVPAAKQEAAYRETLRTSVGFAAQRDKPIYWGYWVERVEVSSPAEAADPRIWNKATRFNLFAARAVAESQWARAARADVVEKKFVDENLVFPLGPLERRSWGLTVAHDPRIPLKKESVSDLASGGQGGSREKLDKERVGLIAPQGATPLARPGPGTPRISTPFDDGDPFRAPEAARPEEKPVVTSETPVVAAAKPEELDKPPEYKLFRFFDFAVEPGRSYVYRVQLVLHNPNFELPAEQLKDPEFAKQAWIATRYSEPSPLIPVPRDSRLLAMAVKKGNDPSSATAKVLLTKWMQDDGDELAKEFSLIRGQVADFPGQPVSGDTDAKALDFITETTAVDFRGGGSLSKSDRDLTELSEILLLDPSGNLVVRTEAGDKSTCDEFEIGKESGSRSGAPPRRKTTKPSRPAAEREKH